MNGKRKVCLLCENNTNDKGQGLEINFRNHYDSNNPKKWVCMPCVNKILKKLKEDSK